MRNYHHRKPERPVQFFQKFENGLRGFGIERGSRFVAQKHFRVGHKSAGDRYPLLLSAGKFRRVCVEFIAEPHRFKKFNRLAFSVGVPFFSVCFLFFFVRIFAYFARKFHVFQNAPLLQKVELLKNHGDLSPNGAKPCVARLGKVLAVYNHAARSGFFQKIYTSHEGAFPRAGQSDYSENVAVVDFKVYVAERGESARFRGVNLAEIY